ncbi:MAG TPA: hypothetical protein VH142_12620 [Polyangiaceae bacterium]|jgi:hypothetical protein|nr:hypothetical protein [Polyangiaceae bacterium]
MGDLANLPTGQPVTEHGIYQSACGCRTALTLLVGQVLPTCLGCDENVGWALVQKIQPSRPPSQRAAERSTRPPPQRAPADTKDAAKHVTEPPPKSRRPPVARTSESGTHPKVPATRRRFDSASGDD